MAVESVTPAYFSGTCTSPCGNGTPCSRGTGSAGTQELSDEEKKEVEKLKKTDAEVRAHEQAHMSAGGAHVRGGATYEFSVGPDGKRYAVGGEVAIDAGPVRGNPQATIAKMQTVRAAALAPANPSGQDRAVAAQAAQTEAQARQELQRQQNPTGNPGSAPGGTDAAGPDSTAGTHPSGYTARGSPLADSPANTLWIDCIA